MENSEKIMKYLIQAEDVAESVLTNRAQIIELDRVRNKVREAARTVSKSTDSKHWVCISGIFVKMPVKSVTKILRHDLDELDNDIGKHRSELRRKVDELRDIENKDSLSGFSLNPLSRQEMRGLENIL